MGGDSFVGRDWFTYDVWLSSADKQLAVKIHDDGDNLVFCDIAHADELNSADWLAFAVLFDSDVTDCSHNLDWLPVRQKNMTFDLILRFQRKNFGFHLNTATASRKIHNWNRKLPDLAVD